MEKHQRQEADRLGLGQQADQQPAEADRLGTCDDGTIRRCYPLLEDGKPGQVYLVVERASAAPESALSIGVAAEMFAGDDGPSLVVDDAGRVVGFLEKPTTEQELSLVRTDPAWIDARGVPSGGRDCLANMGILAPGTGAVPDESGERPSDNSDRRQRRVAAGVGCLQGHIAHRGHRHRAPQAGRRRGGRLGR